jgi:hypothetical protein
MSACLQFFNTYLKNIKDILLETVPLEATGYIKRLASPAPLHSKQNEVFIQAEVANTSETIKIILRSEEYIQALEAHKNEWPIRVKGIAKQGKSMLTISDLQDFHILEGPL